VQDQPVVGHDLRRQLGNRGYRGGGGYPRRRSERAGKQVAEVDGPTAIKIGDEIANRKTLKSQNFPVCREAIHGCGLCSFRHIGTPTQVGAAGTLAWFGSVCIKCRKPSLVPGIGDSPGWRWVSLTGAATAP